MQIQIEKTLDVQEVERHLAELWKQNSGSNGEPDDAAAVLRARVANLLVFVPNDELLEEVRQLLRDLTAVHPSRVVMMLGDRARPDSDIEMAVTSFLQTDKRDGSKRLCCEEVTMKAQGGFVAELPSAALPLLVSDLNTFLWWRDAVDVSDRVFDSLARAADRLLIDSAEFEDPKSNLLETHRLFTQDSCENVGISDLNWARLTFWRALLADFYDVPAYQESLERIDYVRIDYVGPERKPTTVAPQALLIAGWLASRLKWTLSSEQAPQENDQTLPFSFSGNNVSPTATEHSGTPQTTEGPGTPHINDSGADVTGDHRSRPIDHQGSSPIEDRGSTPTRGWGSSPTVREGSGDRQIRLELNRVNRDQHKPGRLVRVELRTSGTHPASFTVIRSLDNLHLTTEAKLGRKVHRGRVLPVRNRSAAQLLSREMEILCNDKIYQEALAVATTLINRSK